MAKGNPHARGTKGNKGGSGRPPKPTRHQLRHHVSFFVNDADWDAIQVGALNAGDTNYRDYLRRNLPHKKEGKS